MSTLNLHPTAATASVTAAMSDTMSSETVPSSFGVFNPVGHVMVGLRTEQAAWVAEVARGCGATLAMHDRSPVVEELL